MGISRFSATDLKNKDFGITDKRAEAPADYRKLKRRWKDSTANRVIMPLIPYDPTNDTLPPRSRALELRTGVRFDDSNKPFFGLGAKYYDVEQSKMHIRYTMRRGVFNGPADGWDMDGARV